MSESSQIVLADLAEWLQKATAHLIEPLKDKGKNLLGDIKDRLDDVRENGDRIVLNSDKELQKESSKTYRCAKAANKMSKNITNKVNQVLVPEDISYENLQSFLRDLEKTFSEIKHERIIWDRRISPYFILDRRRLDITIKRAEDSIQDLRNFLFQKYVKVKNVENTFNMVNKLSKLQEAAEDIKKRISGRETRKKLLEEKIQEKEQKIGLIQDKTELDQLSQLEQRIKDLEVKVKYNLRHLQKPFYKMQSLARRAQIALPPDEARKLQQYMTNSFKALSTEEEGHPLLKRILQILDDAIRQGKLKLKTSRLRKAQEQIDGILKKDSLRNLHQQCLEVASRKRQLSTSETVTATQEELSHIRSTLQKLQRRKESVDSRRKVLEEKHQRIFKRIETQKTELEDSIFELTEKRINVVFHKNQIS